MNSPSGNNIYRYKDCQLEVLPCFLYEVSIYRVDTTRANKLSSRYYTSDKPLNINEVEIIKRFGNFNLERFITLMGAPQSFIDDNNLPLYNLIKKKKS